MGNCALPEVPKYIAGFIEYKHRFNKEFKVEGNFANICIDAVSYDNLWKKTRYFSDE